MPEEVQKVVLKELERLGQMSPAVAAVAVDWLFAAPTAMNPVRRAAAVMPPTPAARRARRAGCGRRRRLIWDSVPVFIEVFLSARSLGLSR